MDKRPIGIFDSGVGGLSVYREIRKLLPKESYIFVADQINVPYGEKSGAEIKRLSKRLSSYFIRMNVKMIVIACNTATCHAIDYLRECFPKTLFVGTVPAIKPAAEKTVFKRVSVMSTPSTAKSPYLKKLIAKYAKGVDVLRIGCYGLEDTVENGDISSAETISLLKKFIVKSLTIKPDYLVLGCTHYPFLKEEMTKMIPRGIVLLDSGEPIARRVKNLLTEKKLASSGPGSTLFFTTGNANRFSNVASILLKKKVSAKKIRV